MRRLRFVPDVTTIDFMGRARLWVAFSILMTVGSLVLIFTRGFNLGVDFRGGALVIASTPAPEDVGRFREVLTGLDFGEVAVTEVSDDTGAGRFTVLMRLGIADPDANAAQVVDTVRAELSAAFPGIQYLQVDSVGSKVSSELVRNGALAVALAFLGIMVYVWLRFEWQFAVGAVLSVMHDALVTLGLFSLLQLEFNLTIVAAVLTVIGYSINDTVVIFDRVRELLRKYKKTPLPQLMNMALNETLSRTVMTSSTTLIALLAIFFFGGDVVHGFAIAMIFGGVLVGTYSTIYVACATVLWLGVRRDWSGAEAASAAVKP
jgi:preprotein translocase SecF subunit